MIRRLLQSPFYVLPARRYQATGRQRWLNLVGRAVVLALALVPGYTYAQADYLHGTTTLTEFIWRWLYFPLLGLAFVTSFTALNVGADIGTGEAWNTLRTTERGVLFSLRGYWLVGFARLRLELFLSVLGRFTLLAAVLVELTSLRGDYLRILAGSLTPPLPFLLAALLLLMSLVGALSLPITGAGLEMALGVFVSRLVQARWLRDLLALALIALRVALSVLILLAFAALLRQANTPEPSLSALLISALHVFGDSGMYALQLTRHADLWALLPHGIWLCLVLPLGAFLQALFSDLLLMAAVRWGESSDSVTR